MKMMLFSALFLATICLQAQTTARDTAIFISIEQMPEFPGGDQAMLRFLCGVNYPMEAKTKGIQGRVLVRFIVEKDGSVTGVRAGDKELQYQYESALPSDGDNDILYKAAIERVQAMPKWKPGNHMGQPERVQYVVPIRFVLDPAGKPKKSKK